MSRDTGALMRDLMHPTRARPQLRMPGYVQQSRLAFGNPPEVSGRWKNIGSNGTQTVAGSTWNIHSSGRPETIQQDVVDSTLFRFTVQPGDQWATDPSTKERAEFSRQTKYSPTTDYEVNYWLCIGPMHVPSTSIVDTNNGWLIIGQIHHTEDAGDAAGLSPPWMREINYNRAMTYKHRTSDTDPLLSNPSSVSDYTTSTFRYGRWILVKEQHRFDSSGGTGYHKVWHNGVQLANYTGNTGYHDAVGPYQKIGIYRYADPDVTQWVMIQGMTIA